MLAAGTLIAQITKNLSPRIDLRFHSIPSSCAEGRLGTKEQCLASVPVHPVLVHGAVAFRTAGDCGSVAYPTEISAPLAREQ